MKLFTILLAGLMGAGEVMAGMDMQIDFPFAPVPVPVALVVPRASTQNLQEFTGALGGAAADPVTATGDSSRPFEVDGATFTTFSAAQSRSCNNQHNACADIANKSAADNPDNVTTTQCDAQQTQCLTFTTPASASSTEPAVTTTSTGAQVLKSEDANFFYFCDT